METATEERWAAVVGYPGYRVSTAGRMQTRRHRNGLPAPDWRDLKHLHDCRGYPEVRLYRTGGRPRWVHVHILVLEAFVGPRPAGMVARHGPAGHADDLWTPNRRYIVLCAPGRGDDDPGSRFCHDTRGRESWRCEDARAAFALCREKNAEEKE